MKHSASCLRGWLLPAISAIAVGTAAGQSPSREPLLPAEWIDGGALVSVHEKTGRVRYVGSAPGQPIENTPAREAAASGQRPTNVEAARGFLSRHRAAFGLRDPGRELRLTRERAVDRRRTFVRFQQTHRETPVLGGEIVVQLDRDQNVLSVHGEVLPDIDIDVAPSVDGAAAQELARGAVAKWHQIDAANLLVSEPALWVYQASLIGPGVGITALVWRVEVTPVDLLPVRELVLVDAVRGSIPLHFNQVPTSRLRQTYTSSNGTFLPGILICDESNPTCSGGDSHGASAHRYAGHTYDFYASYHGRDSLNEAGLSLKSTVHYDFNYYNAFWDDGLRQMVYGDECPYPLADDVVAHEFTHGVTDFESNLYYYYQSGAINESLSDIWGEFGPHQRLR